MSKKYKVPEGFDPVLDDDDNPIDGLADLWSEIKRILGMKVSVDPVTIEWGHVETQENEISDWQQKALKAGWTPPSK